MELFTRDGYESTSVEAIIRKTGVSKGAFYHHFDSKESMLDAVAERMTASFLASFGPMNADDRVPAVRKLDGFFGLLRAWRVSHAGIMVSMARSLYREENTFLRLRMQEKSMEAVQGIFAAVIRQGIGEGTMSVRDPEGTARLLLQLTSAAGEDSMRLLLDGDPKGNVPRVIRILEAVLDACERLLAAAPGTLMRPDRRLVDEFCAAAAGKERES